MIHINIKFDELNINSHKCQGKIPS